MPNQNSTLIVVVLDESGSMAPLAGETIGGLNKLIEDQKKLPGEARFHLVKFSSQSHVAIPFKPLSEVKSLVVGEDYRPSGGTALLDALGKTIDDVGMKLASMAEEDRPGKVVFVVQTDGEENCSFLHDNLSIQAKVKHQTDVYNWNFMYLGANQDAIFNAAKVGILGQNAATYNATNIGTNKLFSSVSAKLRSYRVSGDVKSLSYNQLEREDLTDDSKSTVTTTSNS